MFRPFYLFVAWREIILPYIPHYYLVTTLGKQYLILLLIAAINEKRDVLYVTLKGDEVSPVSL